MGLGLGLGFELGSNPNPNQIAHPRPDARGRLGPLAATGVAATGVAATGIAVTGVAVGAFAGGGGTLDFDGPVLRLGRHRLHHLFECTERGGATQDGGEHAAALERVALPAAHPAAALGGEARRGGGLATEEGAEALAGAPARSRRLELAQPLGQAAEEPG